jgi:hypothetical protein
MDDNKSSDSSRNDQSAQRLIRTPNCLCEPGSMRLAIMFDIVPRGSEWSLSLLPRSKRIYYWLSLLEKAP